MEPNEYTYTVKELINMAFDGVTLIASNINGEVFTGLDFSFNVSDGVGNKININNSTLWKINSIIPAKIERSLLTKEKNFPRGFILDFENIRKSWGGYIKVEMKLTPVSG
jgi:hypothetical protein